MVVEFLSDGCALLVYDLNLDVELPTSCMVARFCAKKKGKSSGGVLDSFWRAQLHGYEHYLSSDTRKFLMASPRLTQVNIIFDM